MVVESQGPIRLRRETKTLNLSIILFGIRNAWTLLEFSSWIIENASLSMIRFCHKFMDWHSKLWSADYCSSNKVWSKCYPLPQINRDKWDSLTKEFSGNEILKALKLWDWAKAWDRIVSRWKFPSHFWDLLMLSIISTFGEFHFD